MNQEISGVRNIDVIRNNPTSNIKNSVRFYLYDCKSGTVKYTVTKDEVKPLDDAEQTSETTNLNNELAGQVSNDSKDIIIKACLNNGNGNTM